MKKLIAIILFTLIFFMPLHMNLAMETVTHFTQETLNQIQESSWWVKAPVLIVGTFAFTKCCDSMYSRMFGKKVATQQEVNILIQNINARNGRIDTLEQEVLALKDLNKTNLDVGLIWYAVVKAQEKIGALEEFAKMKRTLVLARSRNTEELKTSVEGINKNIEAIMRQANISPRNKRHSWGEELSPRRSDLPKKEKSKKRKKGKEKISSIDKEEISSIDKHYQAIPGVGTPRDDFNSEDDFNSGSETERKKLGFVENEGEKYP